MKLETVEQRHKLINDMVSKAFAFEESLIHDPEHNDDWAGAMSTVENLVTIEEFIRTEEIFLEASVEMANVPTRDFETNELFMEIVDNGLNFFVDTILLRRIEFTFDHLNDWDFATAEGVKFQKSLGKKLNSLIKAYQDLYDL